MKLTAVFQKVTGGYVGFVEELPGVNTQGRTLGETRANLTEAAELVMDANRFSFPAKAIITMKSTVRFSS